MTQTTTNKKLSFKFISSFTLHILAMAFMLTDHLYATFFSNYSIMTYIGRLAFPIFAFMIAEGFHHTKDRKKYLKRMLFFALITEIPFNMVVSSRYFNYTHQNVLFTFLFAIIALCIFEKLKNESLPKQIVFYPLTIIFFYILGIISFCDYYGAGVVTVLLFYFTRCDSETPRKEKYIKKLLQIAGIYYINFEVLGGLVIPVSIGNIQFEFPVQGFAIFSLIFIFLYNGKQGPYNKFIKYSYYLFYPLHLLILGIAMKLH